MKHLRGIISLTAILVFLLGAWGPVMAADEAPPSDAAIIREIDIRGFVNLSSGDQEAVRAEIAKLKSKVGEPFEAATAKEDVYTILETGWFVKVEYSTEPMEGGVRLVFNVVENLIISEVDFQGNTVFNNAQLLAVVQSKPGQVLNRQTLAKDALDLRQLYVDQGYVFVEVFNIEVVLGKEGTEEEGKGKLIFHLFEPKIGEIRIEGNNRTKEGVIRNEIVFKTGQVYNEKDRVQSLMNLQNRGLFEEVNIEREPGDIPGYLTMVVRVKEQRTGTATFGVTQNNIRGIGGFIDVADQNLFGTGRRLSARVQFGTDSSYSLSYTDPWITGTRRMSTTFNLYNSTTLRQAVQGQDTFLYKEKRNGGNITVGMPIDSKTRGFGTLRIDQVQGLSDNGEPIPVGLAEQSDVRSIAFSASRDSRYPFLSPFRGSFTTLSTEFAGFGGASFTKVIGETRHYITVVAAKNADENKLPRNWVYATRLKLGTSAGSPPFLDQFLVGGADTLRGYQEDRYPGENMFIWNNELRVPFTDALQGVAFVDVGDAWGGSFAESFGDPNLTVHVGYGLGLRIQTPIGPLRLDYGLASDGGKEFHFGIGSMF